MGLLLALMVLGLMFGGVGLYLFQVVVGAKKTWNEKVAAVAQQAGLKVQQGMHGFLQVVSEQPDGVATAFVNNGVLSEASVAGDLRHFNTNAWLTIISRPYASGSGPQFKPVAGPKAPATWTPRAQELLQRSGGRFTVVSGGQRITIVTSGVVEAPQQVQDMLALAHELATAPAQSNSSS